MSVLECVVTLGEMLQVWHLQLKRQPQRVLPRSSVPGAGLNAPIFFPRPEILGNILDMQNLGLTFNPNEQGCDVPDI